ncbi:FtsX-like permease family protein [Methylonatrum kenyense]|uniref:FtsX-like permease family protein n=1 Tax=Methylonatrum kenyense TaxID=455253 RepID=UPI0020BEDF9A|nr:FtsX-like permease family protein [Methylonatrum kenyense]MCK8515580.1 FtsX-like permease family protein [Methylonatrum kenyense]
MNIWRLTLAYLARNALGTALQVALLALGVATITVLLLLGQQLDDRGRSETRGIDLVVGANGSPLQIILSSVFHVDAPTGNIGDRDVDWLREHPLVAGTIPLSMGDSYQGFRIIGTEHSLVEHYAAELREGELWEGNHQVTIGAEVAAATGLAVGDTFHGVHGIASGDGPVRGELHDDHDYEVAGILERRGRVVDRLILGSVESVWHVHGHLHESDANHDHDHGHGHDEAADDDGKTREITALLISYRSPLAAVTLPRMVNSRPGLQAASPAQETSRLIGLLGVGLDALRLFGGVLLGAAVLGLFVGLYTALRQRRHDMMLLRAMGAPKRVLVGQVLLEALLISLLGALLGLALGHLAMELLADGFAQARQMALTGRLLLIEELYLLLGVLGIGLVAALIPAWQAYRIPVANALTKR